MNAKRLIVSALCSACLLFAVGYVTSSTQAHAGGNPKQCVINCQNQHCPRGKCSDDQHQKRLDACRTKCMR